MGAYSSYVVTWCKILGVKLQVYVEGNMYEFVEIEPNDWMGRDISLQLRHDGNGHFVGFSWGHAPGEKYEWEGAYKRAELEAWFIENGLPDGTEVVSIDWSL